MTTQDLIDALEDLVEVSGDWDVKDENNNSVIGVRLTPKGVVLEVEA